jgi:hypothetical protein
MTAAHAPPLFSCGHEVDPSPDAFGTLRDCTPLLHDVAALKKHMTEEGYVYLPGYLDVDAVLAARRAIVDRLVKIGALAPGRPAMDAVASANYDGVAKHELAQKVPQLETLLYTGKTMAFFERFLGGPVLHYDYTWLRVVAPGKGTPSHSDIVYMGRGTQNLFTAWTPLGDVDRVLGGLILLERSHLHEKLRQTYCKKDVDTYCTNKPSGAKNFAAFGNNGSLGANPPQVRRSLGGRWLTADYRAGDVVYFNAFLVHAGLDNQTDRIRLSSDSRYQLASEPADERWIGENPPAHGPLGKRGKIC